MVEHAILSMGNDTPDRVDVPMDLPMGPYSHHHMQPLPPHNHPLNNNNNQTHPHDMTMPVINNEAEPSICAGCGGKIIDRYYLLAVDRQWHVNCLKCADCKLPLDTELTCFAKDGCIYCKEDYYRRFAVKRCARCHLGISAHELVMRAREHVYHLGCFTCASCHKALTTGDQFGMRDDLIYCRTHYELLLQGDYLPPELSPTGLPGGPPGAPPMHFYNGVGTTQKGRPRKRKSPLPDPDSLHYGLNENDVQIGPDGYATGPQPPRQKRVRTSFKHHQLRTMKSYFALNHNPDAKDLKQLAQKTGLSKRVLQVWFQNARAKYRRNLLKEQTGRDGSTPSAEKIKTESQNSLTEISNSRSPALSDISSTPSLSDLQNSTLDQDQNSSGSSLTELFTNSINSVN